MGERAHLREIWSRSSNQVDIDEIGLCPERSETSLFESLPPPLERCKLVIVSVFTSMDLYLKLTNGKGTPVVTGSMGVLVGGKVFDKCDQRFEFCTFDVDLENIDKVMTVNFHELGKGIHGRVDSWTVVIFGAKGIWVEMRALLEIGNVLNLGTERAD